MCACCLCDLRRAMHDTVTVCLMHGCVLHGCAPTFIRHWPFSKIKSRHPDPFWILVALRPAPIPPLHPPGPPGASCIPRVPSGPTLVSLGSPLVTSGPSGVSLDPPACPPVPLVSLGPCSSTGMVQSCLVWRVARSRCAPFSWCHGALRPLPL
jgi:hypothetical protein